MNEMNQDELEILEKRKFQLEEGILILLLFVSVTGIALTKFSPSEGYRYWMVMIGVFAISAVLIGWFRSKQKGADFKKVLIEQFFHWGSCTLVVCAMFILLHTHHLDSSNTGLIILLLLSQATVLDGQRVGWRFSVLGLYLGISAVLASVFDDYLWMVVALALLLVIFTVVWEYWWHRQQKKQLQNNIN